MNWHEPIRAGHSIYRMRDCLKGANESANGKNNFFVVFDMRARRLGAGRVSSTQVAVNEVAVPEIGCAWDDFVAGFEAVKTAGVEPAAWRDLRRARDVSFEQNVLLLYGGVRNGDVGQQRFGVRV